MSEFQQAAAAALTERGFVGVDDYVWHLRWRTWTITATIREPPFGCRCFIRLDPYPRYYYPRADGTINWARFDAVLQKIKDMYTAYDISVAERQATAAARQQQIAAELGIPSSSIVRIEVPFSKEDSSFDLRIGHDVLIRSSLSPTELLEALCLTLPLMRRDQL